VEVKRLAYDLVRLRKTSRAAAPSEGGEARGIRLAPALTLTLVPPIFIFLDTTPWAVGGLGSGFSILTVISSILPLGLGVQKQHVGLLPGSASRFSSHRQECQIKDG
jgi:hypothetical protein